MLFQLNRLNALLGDLSLVGWDLNIPLENIGLDKLDLKVMCRYSIGVTLHLRFGAGFESVLHRYY